MSHKRTHSNDLRSSNKKKFKSNNLTISNCIVEPTSALYIFKKSSSQIPLDSDFMLDKPKDIQTAIDYLFSLFPTKSIILPPLIFIHQIYSLNLNRTQIDRYINELKQSNKIKLFNFDFKNNDVYLCHTDSLIDYVKGLCNADLKQASSSSSTEDKTQNVKLNNEIINLVCEKFYKKPTEMTISKHELLNECKLCDLDITKLVHNGFLSIKDASSYYHTIPNVGLFYRLITEARKLIKFLIGKKKFHEISLIELKQRNLKKLKQLGILYHCYDMIGNDSVKRVDSPMGFIMQLCNQND